MRRSNARLASASSMRSARSVTKSRAGSPGSCGGHCTSPTLRTRRAGSTRRCRRSQARAPLAAEHHARRRGIRRRASSRPACRPRLAPGALARRRSDCRGAARAAGRPASRGRKGEERDHPRPLLPAEQAPGSRARNPSLMPGAPPSGDGGSAARNIRGQQRGLDRGQFEESGFCRLFVPLSHEPVDREEDDHHDQHDRPDRKPAGGRGGGGLRAIGGQPERDWRPSLPPRSRRWLRWKPSTSRSARPRRRARRAPRAGRRRPAPATGPRGAPLRWRLSGY